MLKTGHIYNFDNRIVSLVDLMKWEKPVEEMYFVDVEFHDDVKRLYTVAKYPELAAEKIHRHIICQWVGGIFEDPETLLEGVFDKLENGSVV